MKKPYYLGCPMWSNKQWNGSLFKRKAKPNEFLAQYSKVMSSVEGNTTFYALPKPEVVAKWYEATPKGFKFTFKFPRTISHDQQLQECEADTQAFFERLAPLGHKLGPLFLQLPPNFANLNILEHYLRKLPPDFEYAVEVRGPFFHRGDAVEEHLHQLLIELGMDRVVFDTHRLMQMSTKEPELMDAQRRKPKSPVRQEPTGPRPFLRFVGHPHIEHDRDVITQWAVLTAGWIREGRTPYIFMHHAPDDVDAPPLCRLFHKLLRERLPSLEPMAPWPGEQEPPEPVQLELF